LELEERQEFVWHFTKTLMSMPREHRRPCLVIVDEADIFCAEGSSRGKSAKDEINVSAECSRHVIDLCVRGRKRGLVPILATQRPAMISKMASSQCNNKLIGRFAEDVDIARAAKTLGISPRHSNVLAKLEKRMFFAVGPAFNIEQRTLVRIGDCLTSMPQPGELHAAPPPPRGAIAALLKQLAEETEAATKSETPPSETTASVAMPLDEQRLRAEYARGHHDGRLESFRERDDWYQSRLRRIRYGLIESTSRMTRIVEAMDACFEPVNNGPVNNGPVDNEPVNNEPVDNAIAHGMKSREEIFAEHSVDLKARELRQIAEDDFTAGAINGSKPKAEQRNGGKPNIDTKILTVLAQQGPLPRNLILFHAEYIASGHTQRAFTRLKRDGLIDEEKGKVSITRAGLAQLGDYEPLPKGRALLEHALAGSKLNRVEKALLYQAAICPRLGASRADLLTKLGYSPSGYTQRAFTRLKRFGYVEESKGMLRLADTLR
jgi:hypothetical protein